MSAPESELKKKIRNLVNLHVSDGTINSSKYTQAANSVTRSVQIRIKNIIRKTYQLNSNEIQGIIKSLTSILKNMSHNHSERPKIQNVLVLLNKKNKLNSNEIAGIISSLSHTLSKMTNVEQSKIQKILNSLQKPLTKVVNTKVVNTRAIANKVWDRAWGGYLGVAGNYDYKKLANEILRNSKLLHISPVMKNDINAYINTKRNALQKHRAHGIVAQMTQK